MLIRKLFHFTGIIMALIVFSSVFYGCNQHKYNKKILSFVLVKEIDDIYLDNVIIEDYMSHYYENSDIEFTSSAVNENNSGMLTSFTVKNKNSDFSAVHNDDNGECIEFETVEQAKEEWSSYYFSNFSIVEGMQTFCVRIGKYIFFTGADLWKPLFDKIGVPLEKKTFSVANENDVTYEKIENYDLNQLIKILKKNNYSVLSILQGDSDYTVISADGDEMYTIINSRYLYKEFKKNRKDLNEYWFQDDVSGVMTCSGLTVYDTDSYMVISRGDSWVKLLKVIQSKV